MEEVTPGLFIGGAQEACDLSALQDHRILSVLVVAQECEPQFPHQFQYLHVPIPPFGHSDLPNQLHTAAAFITHALPHGPVLVHCSSGRNRSAAVVAFFLMEQQSMSFKEAYGLIKGCDVC